MARGHRRGAARRGHSAHLFGLIQRKPAAQGLTSEFDSPLAWRYDESDSMLMCENVKVPWEKVFVHNDAVLARDIYIKTPAHCYGNHQSNVRFHAKMELLVGLASRITQASGAAQIPAVRETLEGLKAAGLESLTGGGAEIFRKEVRSRIAKGK